MKTTLTTQIFKFTVLLALAEGLALSAAGQGTNAADAPSQSAASPNANPAAVREKLNEQLSEAADFYLTLQAKPQTSIPNQVVVQAKGVLIINRWSDEIGGRAAGGYAIGMRKLSDGKFSAPVFYTLAGASLGLQAAGEKTHALIFLMSDKAARILTDDKFAWSGLKIASGSTATNEASVNNNSGDALVYLSSPKADVETVVTETKISPDNERTRIFYGKAKPGLTADDVFAGDVKTPSMSKQIISYYLNDQAKNVNPTLPPTETPGVISTELPSASGAALGSPIPGSPNVALH